MVFIYFLISLISDIRPPARRGCAPPTASASPRPALCAGGDYGASRLYTNNHDRHCDATKDKATEKPNARRVGNGMEGASKTMGTLARNSFYHEWRAQKLEWVRGSNTSHGASESQWDETEASF